jgi:signal transduction histidine kinase
MHLHRSRFRSAFRPHLPGRTVRSRLTLVYGGLFLVSGAALLTITALLWGRATGSDFVVSAKVPIHILSIAGPPPGAAANLHVNFVGQRKLPVGQNLPPDLKQLRQVTAQLRSVAAGQQNADLHQLLLYSGIALGIAALLAIALGWLTAGRVLRPLRTLTSTAQDISATNLHERLDMKGPNDELKVLGDTIDQLLERLDRSFQSQRLFVANASHELRTPLATMRASIDVALAKPEPIPQQTTMLADRLRLELDHVDRLLESFLALARAQRGPVDEDATLSLDLFVASALEQRAGAIAELGLDVDEEISAAAQVIGDEILLARMVENVIDNAVHHNERGGFVRVRTETEGGNARLVVENGGPVLDEDDVQGLVRPFQRIGAARTGTEAGFGLGLSIVAAITETHGGRLELHALSGGGLQVLIELPLAVRTLAEASA